MKNLEMTKIDKSSLRKEGWSFNWKCI